MARWSITKVSGDTTSGVWNAGTTTSRPSRSMRAGSASLSDRPAPRTRGIYHPRVSTLHKRAKCLRNKPAATGEI